MSFVQVRDHALWVDDIHGGHALQARIRAMKEGELIELKVEGVRGSWRRLRDGAGGRNSPGIKAVGYAQSKWHELRDQRRGGIATVELCD
jgi:hypothetical protein